jgi:hypothetical protein
VADQNFSIMRNLILFISCFTTLNFCLSQQNIEYQRAKNVFISQKNTTFVSVDTIFILDRSVITKTFQDSLGSFYVSNDSQSMRGQIPSNSVILKKGTKSIIYNFLRCSKEELATSDNCAIRVTILENDNLIYCANFYDQKLMFLTKYHKGVKKWHETIYVGKSQYSLENIDRWFNDLEYLTTSYFINLTSSIQLRDSEEILYTIFR